MTNYVMLIGKLTEKPIFENDKKDCKITLAVPRSFKNENGEYETDFIDCQLYGYIAQNTVDWINKGELVGVKGRLQVVENNLLVIAEKITFLSTKKAENDEDGGVVCS